MTTDDLGEPVRVWRIGTATRVFGAFGGLAMFVFAFVAGSGGPSKVNSEMDNLVGASVLSLGGIVLLWATFRPRVYVCHKGMRIVGIVRTITLKWDSIEKMRSGREGMKVWTVYRRRPYNIWALQRANLLVYGKRTPRATRAAEEMKTVSINFAHHEFVVCEARD